MLRNYSLKNIILNKMLSEQPLHHVIACSKIFSQKIDNNTLHQSEIMLHQRLVFYYVKESPSLVVINPDNMKGVDGAYK